MDMRKVKFAMMILAASLLTACGSSKKEQSVNEETAAARTQETENLLANLKKIPSKGIMLGHHDDTVYGIGWEGEEGRSDVKSVCGDYPAVISFDLGELELGNAANLDKVPFDKIRKEIINQYQRGGMVSLSWHARNPKTGGDAWDVSDTTVVKDPLSVIAQHGEQFTLFHAACIGGCQGEAAGFVAVGIPGLIVDFNVKLRRVTRILHGICKGVRQLAQLKNLVALCTLLDGVDQLGGRVPGFFDKFTAYRVGLRLIVHGAGRLRPVDFGAARLGGRLCRIDELNELGHALLEVRDKGGLETFEAALVLGNHTRSVKDPT